MYLNTFFLIARFGRRGVLAAVVEGCEGVMSDSVLRVSALEPTEANCSSALRAACVACDIAFSEDG